MAVVPPALALSTDGFNVIQTERIPTQSGHNPDIMTAIGGDHVPHAFAQALGTFDLGTRASAVARLVFTPGVPVVRGDGQHGTGPGLGWFWLRGSIVPSAGRGWAARVLPAVLLRTSTRISAARQYVLLLAAGFATAESRASERLWTAPRLFAPRWLCAFRRLRAVHGRWPNRERAILSGRRICLPAGAGHTAGRSLLVPRTWRPYGQGPGGLTADCMPLLLFW